MLKWTPTQGAGLVLVVMLSAVGVAHADEATGRRLLERAVEAREAGRLLESERLLRESLAQHNWTYPAFVLGQVLQEMERPRDALAVFQALERGEHGEVTGRARRELTAALRETRARLAMLAVTWAEPGPLVIRVDGEVVFDDAAVRAAELPVNPGRRIVTAERPGAPTVEHVIEAEAGQTHTLALVLRAVAQGRYRLRAEEDVEIEIEGVATGRGALEGQAPVGSYRLRWRDAAAEDERILELVAGQPVEWALPRPGDGGGVEGWVIGLSVALGVVAVTAAAIGLGVALTPGLPEDVTGT